MEGGRSCVINFRVTMNMSVGTNFAVDLLLYQEYLI